MEETVLMKRVVIIGDSDLSLQILDDIKSLGASGYTYYTVHGGGSLGRRRRFTREDPTNVKIELIAPSALAHRILNHVAENYSKRNAMIAFIDEVEVLASENLG